MPPRWFIRNTSTEPLDRPATAFRRVPNVRRSRHRNGRSRFRIRRSRCRNGRSRCSEIRSTKVTPRNRLIIQPYQQLRSVSVAGLCRDCAMPQVSAGHAQLRDPHAGVLRRTLTAGGVEAGEQHRAVSRDEPQCAQQVHRRLRQRNDVRRSHLHALGRNVPAGRIKVERGGRGLEGAAARRCGRTRRRVGLDRPPFRRRSKCALNSLEPSHPFPGASHDIHPRCRGRQAREGRQGRQA